MQKYREQLMMSTKLWDSFCGCITSKLKKWQYMKKCQSTEQTTSTNVLQNNTMQLVTKIMLSIIISKLQW